MTAISALRSRLRGLDGRGYGAYRSVKGAYDAGDLVLHIEHVQGDPFATPSRFRIEVPAMNAGYPEWARSTRDRRRAAADFVNRILLERMLDAPSTAGSGRSGELRVLRPGQEVLERTSVQLHEDGSLDARFRVGLPARGRRILGRAAAQLVCTTLRELANAALLFPSLDAARLRRHVETVEDAVLLRAQLRDHDLVAFVADGSRLPRRSGVDDRPLQGDAVVPFEAPASLRVELKTPNSGPVVGMGIPSGMTLIVGGGYHGKSTLLRALERGVYDHVPGDGRERVVAVPEAVKVRAEDGRSVAGSDISNFIGPLPGGADTRCFRTENASGSTSQAAAIVEALEVGARALLLDEDTSATNFMIRDARMQRLVSATYEPIIPFIDRVRELSGALGVSTVAVIGGSGDYFDVADTVIAMKDYRPAEVTDLAREAATSLPTSRRQEGEPWVPVARRRPLPQSIDARKGRRSVYIRVRSSDRVELGVETVDLSAVEQIVEAAQTRAMAHALVWARGVALDGRLEMTEAVQRIMSDIEEQGLEVVHPHDAGELAAFRRFELAALLNRLRTLETEPVR